MGTHGRVGGVLAAAMLLSGCWTQIGGDAGHTRFNSVDGGLNAGNVDQLTGRWTIDLGAASATEPVVEGGRVFTTRWNPAEGYFVSAFDAATGDPLWDVGAASARTWAGPAAVSGEELWVPASATVCPGPRLLHLDPATGDVLGGDVIPVLTSVVTGGGAVAYVVNDFCQPGTPDRLVVLDAESEAGRWSFTFPEPNEVEDTSPARTTRSDQTPTIAHGRVYVANADTVYAFALDGTPLWTEEYPEKTLLPPVALPEGGVLVGTNEVNLDGAGQPVDRSPTYGLAGDSGAEIFWSNWPGTLVSTAVTGDTLLYAFDVTGDVASLSGRVWASDLTGASRWWASYADRVPAQIAVGGDVVYAAVGPSSAGDEGTVEAFATAGCGSPFPGSCSPITSVTVPGAPEELSVADGRVHVVSTTEPGFSALSTYGLP